MTLLCAYFWSILLIPWLPYQNNFVESNDDICSHIPDYYRARTCPGNEYTEKNNLTQCYDLRRKEYNEGLILCNNNNIERVFITQRLCNYFFCLEIFICSESMYVRGFR